MNTEIIKVYQSITGRYINKKVIGKYKYIGGEGNSDLTVGKIYNRIESEDEFRIVDDSEEDYLYVPSSFIKIE